MNAVAPYNPPRRMRELELLSNVIEAHPLVAKQLSLSTGRGRFSYNDRLERKSSIQTKYNELKARRDGIIESSAPTFRNHVRAEIENDDFAVGKQWTDVDRQQLNDAGLYAHRMNLHTRWIRVLMGEHRASETVFHAIADDLSPRNKLATEFLNNGLHAVAYDQNYSSQEQQWYYDGAVLGRGYMLVAPDPKDPFGRILTERCRPQEFMDDIFSAKDGHLTDCDWLFRGRLVSLDKLIRQYPEYEDEFMSVDMKSRCHWDLDFTLTQPRMRYSLDDELNGLSQINPNVVAGRNKTQWFQQGFGRMKPMAYTQELYNRRTEPGFAVWDCVAGVEYPFDNLPQAIAFYKDQQAMYYYLFASQGMDASQTITVEEPRPYDIDVMDKEVWVGDMLVDYTPSRDVHFPYVKYSPSYRDGFWRGFFEDDKDPQRWTNKLLVYLEELLGSSKSKNVYNKHFFPSDWTVEDIENVGRHASKDIVLDDMNPQAAQYALHRHDAANNAAMPAMIMDKVMNGSRESQGGVNALGLSEGASQSGRSINLLQRASSNAKVDLIAELRDAQRIVGQRVAYLLQFIKPGKRLAWIDSDKRYKFLQFTTDIIRDIRSISYQIEISETLATPSERDRKQMTLMEALGQRPELYDVALPEFLEICELDQTQTESITARHEEQMAYTRSVQERELKNKEQTDEMKLLLQKQDRINAQTEMLLKYLTPKFNITGDLNEFGPAGKSEVMNMFGFDTDPEGMGKDTSDRLLIEQDAADLAVVRWFKTLPAEERKAFLASKAAMPKQPETGKDRANRSIKET